MLMCVAIATVNRSPVDADDVPGTAEATATAGDAEATPANAEGAVSKTAQTPASQPEPPSMEDLPWELRPYRVLVSLALADRRAMNTDFENATTASINQLIRGNVGDYWQPTLELNQWLFPQTRVAIDGLTAERLTERYASTEFDKVLIVVIEADGPGYRLTGCEWDRATQSRGPTRERPVVDRRRIASVTFEMLFKLLRPIAEIELAEGEFAELRVRGGELIASDSPLFPFHTGDLLTGHFRYLDRDRQVRKIQGVPWTYLRIDSINRSRMTATIETAFANPLSGSRRRVELIAVRIEPTYASTDLNLSPRTNLSRPLVGVRVRIYDELPTEENPQPERLDLMTDREGTVTVPANSEHPLRRLIVHSGGAVLSNVPFVPGVERHLSMELPDDSPRLQVEGNLAMVQGDLIDVVSRRVVMLARAVSQARKEKFEDADKLLSQVDAQPSIASFESRILAIRVPAVDQARANRDRAQEKRIRMMCRDLEDLVRKYLDRQKVDDAKAEVRELKQLAGT